MNLNERIQDFLAGTTFAVAGASPNRAKFGNKVLRCYLQNGRRAFAVNPLNTEVEGVPCVKTLAELPEPVHGLSIITPPQVTEKLVEDAHKAGIKRIWMQPGAESDLAIQRCRALGISLISGGPCLLVVLGFSERA